MTIVPAPVRIVSLRVLHPHRHGFTLNIFQGSIVGFRPSGHPSAIVNAANTQCLGGGGVDGAISDAGGPSLHKDRLQLPIIQHTSHGQAIRCPTGSAVITGPGTYGSLHVPFIIHAVGPDYNTFDAVEFDQADSLLQSAYSSSLQLGKDHQMKCIAFSLLSAGVYRGKRGLKHVLKIGLDSIVHFDGYEELNEVSICAFSKQEVDAILEITHSLEKDGLVELNK